MAARLAEPAAARREVEGELAPGQNSMRAEGGRAHGVGDVSFREVDSFPGKLIVLKFAMGSENGEKKPKKEPDPARSQHPATPPPALPTASGLSMRVLVLVLLLLLLLAALLLLLRARQRLDRQGRGSGGLRGERRGRGGGAGIQPRLPLLLE